MIVSFVTSGATAWGQAKDQEIPAIVIEGLQAYEKEGAEAALKAWLKGSPLEGSKEVMSQVNILRAVESFYGSYKVHHLTHIGTPSKTTKFIYLIMDYEKGPIFAKFVAFKGEAGWHIVAIKFHTEADQVWPTSLLLREKQ